MEFCVMDPRTVRVREGDLLATIVREDGERMAVSATEMGLESFRRILDESERFRVSSLLDRIVAARGVVHESTVSRVIIDSDAGERLIVPIEDSEERAVPGTMFEVLGARRGDVISMFRAAGVFRPEEPESSPLSGWS
ncbi:MAG: hypothetical protein DI629_20155 [Mesorhizobium amorphae]|nr:MAG: hypothetical protein DI629_20155 [Mesorhizobium amorphae]